MPNAAPRTYKRRWRNYLINRHLQVRYTLMLLAITVALYGILGYLFYNEVTTQDLMLANLQGTEASLKAADADPEEVALLKAQMELLGSERRNIVTVLFVALFGLVSVLFLGSIFVTHRIAGPVYAVTLYLNDLAEGRWRRIRPFRKGDEFGFLRDGFDRLYDTLTQRERDELASLQHVRDALDGNPAQLGAKAVVEQIMAEKKARLEA